MHMVGLNFLVPGTLVTGGRVDCVSWSFARMRRDAPAKTDVMAVMAIRFVIRQLSFLGKETGHFHPCAHPSFIYAH